MSEISSTIGIEAQARPLFKSIEKDPGDRRSYSDRDV